MQLSIPFIYKEIIKMIIMVDDALVFNLLYILIISIICYIKNIIVVIKINYYYYLW